MRTFHCLALIALLAGSAIAAAAPPDSVDAVARDYVELVLGARMLDADLVAVKVPRPAELERAQAAKRDAAAIGHEAGALLARLDKLPQGDDRLDAMRWRALRARLASLRYQLQPKDAPKVSVAEEVRRQYGFAPDFPALAGYDAALEALSTTMPGKGELSERIAAMRNAAIVPPERLEAVFQAALAECRKRTAQHIDIQAESIELRFPDDSMFPAGAEYVGAGKSVVTVSRTIPADVDRILQTACHEVYPGHHLHYVMLDNALYRQRDWIEYAVELGSGPFVPVAEAVAEYGVGLAFPVDERVAFARDVLFPLAGLKMEHPEHWRAFIAAHSSVLGASSTVARDFLAGTIDRDEAHRLFVRYRLQTPAAADQMMKMLPVVGSYIIASDMGWYTVDRAMQGKGVEEQWRLLGQILREPMLLDDIEDQGEYLGGLHRLRRPQRSSPHRLDGDGQVPTSRGPPTH